jgi:hypothetical protein
MVCRLLFMQHGLRRLNTSIDSPSIDLDKSRQTVEASSPVMTRFLDMCI